MGGAVKAEETKEEAKEGAKEGAKEEAKDDVKMEVKEEKEEDKKEEPKAFAVDVVQAKYGNSFFAAKIMEIGDEKIKVKWDHDSSETEVPKDEVKAKEAELNKDEVRGKAVKAEET